MATRLPVFIYSFDGGKTWRVMDAETNQPARDQHGELFDRGGLSEESHFIAHCMAARVNKVERGIRDNNAMVRAAETFAAAFTHSSSGGGESAEPAGNAEVLRRQKRSTPSGEAAAKIVAALTAHHGYSNGGCDTFTPIGVNELARKAGVGTGSASRFFGNKFKGYNNYERQCGDRATLCHALALLNGEVTPAILSKPLYGNESADD